MRPLVCHNGKWHVIEGKPDEPDRQTIEIAWKQIKTEVTPEDAYRSWYADQRDKSKVLYLNKKKDGGH